MNKYWVAGDHCREDQGASVEAEIEEVPST